MRIQERVSAYLFLTLLLLAAGSYNTGNFNTLSYQTGSYISPNGTVILYPIAVAPAPSEEAASAPTLSDLIGSVFGGSFQPITNTTSLGSLIDGFKG